MEELYIKKSLLYLIKNVNGLVCPPKAKIKCSTYVYNLIQYVYNLMQYVYNLIQYVSNLI